MLNRKLDSNFKEILSNFAVASGYFITIVTKKVDQSFHPTDLSLWMDTYNGHIGGFDHRVKHGHDFAANIVDVYDNFGLHGVAQYPFELFKDFTTPHGIPIPASEFAVHNSILSARKATHWLSLNAADILTGGLAAYGTYCLYKKTKRGKIDSSSLIWASIGIGTKVTAGIITHNPVLLLSGLTDSVLVVSSITQAKQIFNDLSKKAKIFVPSAEAKAKTGSLGIALGVGAGSATAATGLVSTFGLASTGSAISTLSGAAATNATLAAIGGGSLASGGLGMAGGLVILSGGAAVAGLAAGAGAYYLMKQKQIKKFRSN
ncbi:MAG: hypothetical protein AB8G05_05475 [Oligoflexales bacterium]